jgi:hypothetical protein
MNDANGVNKYKKHRLALSLTLGLATTTALQGCATIQDNVQSSAEQNPVAFCGTASLFTGGAAWAGCHYLLNQGDAACIITAVAAAVADGLNCWWLLKQKIVEDYDDTRKKLNYSPSQGYLVKILDFGATPNVVHPGEEVKIRAQYALMSPNPMEEIQFERKITLPGDNKPRTELITYQPGTWGIEDYPFKIDAATPEGKIELTLELKLVGQAQSDRQTLCFNVVHGAGAPAAKDQCPPPRMVSSATTVISAPDSNLPLAVLPQNRLNGDNAGLRLSQAGIQE